MHFFTARLNKNILRSSELQHIFKTSQIILGYANPPNPIKVLLRFNAEQNWTPSPDNEHSESDLMYAAVHEVYSYTLKCILLILKTIYLYFYP